MSFPLSAMFDEMLEEVKVDWSDSESARATAGAGGWPVSPQSGRGAGPISALRLTRTRHGGNKSAARVFLTAHAAAFSLIPRAS